MPSKNCTWGRSAKERQQEKKKATRSTIQTCSLTKFARPKVRFRSCASCPLKSFSPERTLRAEAPGRVVASPVSLRLAAADNCPAREALLLQTDKPRLSWSSKRPASPPARCFNHRSLGCLAASPLLMLAQIELLGNNCWQAAAAPVGVNNSSSEEGSMMDAGGAR